MVNLSVFLTILTIFLISMAFAFPSDSSPGSIRVFSGYDGKLGPKGPKGMPGKNGYDGKPGKLGKDGKPGSKGNSGKYSPRS